MGEWWAPVQVLGALFLLYHALSWILARATTPVLCRVLQSLILLYGLSALTPLSHLNLGRRDDQILLFICLLWALPSLGLGLGQFLPRPHRKGIYRFFLWTGLIIAIPVGVLLGMSAAADGNRMATITLAINVVLPFFYLCALAVTLEKWKQAAPPAELWLGKAKQRALRLNEWWDFRATAAPMPGPVNEFLFQTSLSHIPSNLFGTSQGDDKILEVCRKYPQVEVAWKTAYFILLSKRRYVEAVSLLLEARKYGFDDLGFRRALAYAMCLGADTRWKHELEVGWSKAEDPKLYSAFYFDVENDPAEIWSVQDIEMVELRRRLQISYVPSATSAGTSLSTTP